MLLQCLTLSDAHGFTVKDMECDLYNHDALLNGIESLKLQLANNTLSAKCISFVELHHDRTFRHVSAVVLSGKRVIDSIGDELKIKVSSRPFHTSDPEVVAWIHVSDPLHCLAEDMVPMFIIRQDVPDLITMVHAFMDHYDTVSTEAE